MRREKRPFMIEVRKGPARGVSAPPLVDAMIKPENLVKPDKMIRAEAVFSTQQSELRDVVKGAELPPRRILEAISLAPRQEPEIETSRRGRKPGSKNKPKDISEASFATKRPRGRPRRHPDGEVRSVKPTPDVARAALQSIARASISAPITPVPGGSMYPIPMFEPAPKRKRGRPRKVRAPKFDWTTWSAGDETEEAPIAAVVPLPVYTPAAAEADSPVVPRFESAGPRLRAGERWKRRIRVPGGGPLRPRAHG